MNSMRLDQALIVRHLAESRGRAADLIAQGCVVVNREVARKPSQRVKERDVIAVTGAPIPWVSRGAYKLVHAIEHWDIKLHDLIALDVGASTGGFTDVLLYNAVRRVHAVDVGHDQLHVKLRNHPCVRNLEGVNARELELDEQVDVIVCDARFISAKLVLERPLTFAKEKAHLITLIKPQFEVGKDKLPKDGVVKDEAERERACKEVEAWVKSKGWQIQGIIESPIEGPKGNKEFLLYALLG